jgi:hypothetical protein
MIMIFSLLVRYPLLNVNGFEFVLYLENKGICIIVRNDNLYFFLPGWSDNIEK